MKKAKIVKGIFLFSVRRNCCKHQGPCLQKMSGRGSINAKKSKRKRPRGNNDLGAEKPAARSAPG